MGFIRQHRIKHPAPPKGQVAGSNPAWDTIFINWLRTFQQDTPPALNCHTPDLTITRQLSRVPLINQNG